MLPLKAATVRREALQHLEDLPGWANTVIGQNSARDARRGAGSMPHSKRAQSAVAFSAFLGLPTLPRTMSFFADPPSLLPLAQRERLARGRRLATPGGQGGWTKIAQIGGVVLGNDCEIGANTTVDRGAIEDTVLGNGAYLAPDLTRTYANTGPAWLAAFLPSAGGWPTGPAVQVLLQKPELQADAGVADFDAYLAKFPGAAERIRRRGGHPSYMPNLPLSADEVNKLIAFMKYISEMDTEGWPPKPKVDGLTFPQAKPMPGAVVAEAATDTAATTEASVPADPAARGEQLAAEYACTSCHASDASTKVGPGWGGLYDASVTLADGSTVKADDAYLAEAFSLNVTSAAL